jgi:hypothetical protein
MTDLPNKFCRRIGRYVSLRDMQIGDAHVPACGQTDRLPRWRCGVQAASKRSWSKLWALTATSVRLCRPIQIRPPRQSQGSFARTNRPCTGPSLGPH